MCFHFKTKLKTLYSISKINEEDRVGVYKIKWAKQSEN